MSTVTQEYVDSLPEIYRDILAAFPQLEPYRNAGDGLAYQTLYEGLQRKHSLGAIIQACEQMAKGNAVVMRAGIFVCPTEVGEEIIAALTGKKPSERRVPDFPTPK